MMCLIIDENEREREAIVMKDDIDEMSADETQAVNNGKE